MYILDFSYFENWHSYAEKKLIYETILVLCVCNIMTAALSEALNMHKSVRLCFTGAVAVLAAQIKRPITGQVALSCNFTCTLLAFKKSKELYLTISFRNESCQSIIECLLLF